MTPVSTIQANSRQAGWNLNASGARRAADRASSAARVAADWAGRSGAGHTEAAEAACAAARARRAAERAVLASSAEEARREAIIAWTAAEAALDADRRTCAAISEAMWAEMDRGVRGTVQAA